MRTPEGANYTRVGNGSSKAQLLPGDFDFQAQYSAAIERLTDKGIEVHNRDPREQRSIICIDEGLIPPTPVTVRVPPVLLFANAVESLQTSLGEVVIKSVYHHDDCGAAKLYRKLIGLENSIDTNRVGEINAKILAKNLDRKQKTGHEGVRVRHEGILPLERRPHDLHTGQVIIFDNRISGLDPSHIEGMPISYVLSRRVLGSDVSEEFGHFAMNLALNESNGLGARLSEPTPLHLVGMAQEQREIGRLQDELSRMRRIRGLDADRIRTSVITAPNILPHN